MKFDCVTLEQLNAPEMYITGPYGLKSRMQNSGVKSQNERKTVNAVSAAASDF
jgi:hypothetical protein